MLKRVLEQLSPTIIAVIAINGMMLVAFLAFLWFLTTV